MKNRILVSVQEEIDEPSWLNKIESFADKCLCLAGYEDEEVSIFFCSDNYIQQLNLSYRNIDSPTDVLSFENGEEYKDEDGVVWFQAGDIAISLETLPVNCRYFDVSENEELKRLIIHGLLHLNGYDHGEEHVEKNVEPVCEMLKLQKEIMEKTSEDIIIG